MPLAESTFATSEQPKQADKVPDRPAVRLGPILYSPPSVASSSSNGSSSTAGAGDFSLGPGTSVSDDLLRMFDQSVLSDIEVICTDRGGRVFRAHRLILAARSPVFRAMFLTGMRERRAGKVFIEDVTEEAVKCMLDFAYKDRCPDLEEDNIFDVLKLADKYDMPGLRDLCLDFMAQNARSDNVVNFIAAADSYNLVDFKHTLLSSLVDNSPALHECVLGPGLDAHPELMKQLLALCAHRLSRATKERQERRVVKHFDGLPCKSRCLVCVREVASMPKQMLGEMLYPMVRKIQPEHANKITGMIIELDNLELVPLFESEAALSEKVEEAVAVLKAAESAEDIPSTTLFGS
eukprot:gnl/TRDRNA2_/TRDRNA2_192555_c0_seq1.p1 gnl/TRDRNA2_/TRDRNA2_192555_c0~~gnl/TRDRNA2_/TRDRNA2_192555_c0_seq1.p1  ORF type:complete len:350 (+),score=73.28 gnl/TRDRNA2_/TRDRNA2_192555_c0_seq1:79-1128(+)